MNFIDMPRYALDDDTRTGKLQANFSFGTAITGHDCDDGFVVLSPSGILSISAGFVWDFGSGPAIDTPEMVAASLAHDALYSLIRSGELPKGKRRAADKLFRKLLKKYGVGFIRRNYCYYAVRLFGGTQIG